MTKPMKLLGIAGSLSAVSRNRAVLKTVQEHLPVAIEMEIFDLRDIPLYDPALDRDVSPAPVGALKQAIETADAVIIASPEYNYGMPGVLKNALDWASRPAYRSPLKDKPVGILTVSPAATGGVRAQQDLKYVLTSTLSQLVPHREVAIAGASDKIQDGRLVDEQALAAVIGMVGEVVAYVGDRRCASRAA